MADDALQVIGSAIQIVAQALGRTAYEHGSRTMAQVTVDDEHFLLLDGERHRHVGNQVGLAGTRIEGSKEDDVLFRMRSDGELKVGTQYAECLVHDVALACLHHNLAGFLLLLPELDALLQGRTVLAADIERNLAQEWDGYVLQVLAATHGGVHVFTHEDDDHRNEEAQYECHQQDVAAHWCHRQVAACRRSDDAGIIGGESLGKLVFLTLLEEEEIERLLYLLLTAYSLQILSLVRVAGNLRGGMRLVCLQGTQLGTEGYHKVVDTCRNTSAHGIQVLVVIGNQRVLLAGVGNDVVALQQSLVVFSNLLLDARTVDTGIGWQHLVLAHSAYETAADILCNGEAGVEIHDLLAQVAALLHILLCCGLYVRQQVGTLEGRDILIHVAQLMLDNAKALGDETGGGNGHLILVVEPVLAVYGDDGVEDILGTLGLYIRIGKIYDGSLLLVQSHRERAQDAIGHGIEVSMAYVECRCIATLDKGSVRWCSLQLYLAQWSLNQFAQLTCDGLVGLHWSSIRRCTLEIGEFKLFSLLQIYGHRTIVFFADGEELYGDRQVVAIEHIAVESSIDGIIHIEFQLLAYFHKNGRRLDGNEFVVNVRLGASQSHIGEHRLHIIIDGATFAFILDKQGSRALIYIRCREDIIAGCSHRNDEREHEPFPSGYTEIKEVLQAEEIIPLVTAKHRIRTHLIRRIRVLYHS